MLGALDKVGLRLAAEPAGAVTAEQLHGATAREMMLFALWLYSNLPQYVPKATVSFGGGLHERLSKTIELSNPSKKPIAYEVRLEGAACFKIDESYVRVEGKSSLPFRVEVCGVFQGEHSARLVFLSRGDGVGTANASTLVFELRASIDVGAPLATFSTDSRLYHPNTLSVSVTNPFDVPCHVKLAFRETRPPLDLPKLAAAEKEATTEKAQGLSLKGAGQVVAATNRAAKLAGITAFGGAGAGDDVTKKLPSTFWCASPTLSLDARGTAALPVQFLPFQLGEYSCTLVFSDEAVGEFSYQLRGVASLPPPIDTLTFASESASSAFKEVTLPFRNPLLEKARQAVLDRSTREKERMGQLWGKEPLVRGPLTAQLSYGSPFFSGPPAVELVDDARRKGGASRGGGAVPQSNAGSGVNTPSKREASAQPATGASAADANKLNLRFVPNEPGQYNAELLFLSPLDVRLYELAGSCAAPGMRAALEFTSPARASVRQDVPIVNNTDADWTVSANLRGDDFRGPPTTKVSANSTGWYPIEFAPEWVCEREGELTLTNQNTGDKYVFSLRGIGEEPLAEAHIALSVEARVATPITFNVFNMSEKADKVELSVQSDLVHVSGPPTVRVPARASRGSRPENLEYVLTAKPQMGGVLSGSITFTAPDGRYLWYTVELDVTPPPAERSIEVSAPLRKVVSVEIPISNPTSLDLEFTVIISGDGLLGDETILVPAGPDSRASYELLFSPLLAGTAQGSIAFVSPVAGEFWYELTLTGEPSPPTELPLLHTSVGGTVTHTFTVSNPVGEELSLACQNTNPANFRIEGPRGGPLVLPPYGELEATLSYSPSALEIEQTATIVLTHPKLGEWEYSCRGVGHAPAEMAVTEATAPLGATTSGTITFRNPFDVELAISIAMEQPAAQPSDELPATPLFELLARRTSGVLVQAGSSVQLPFSFLARDMEEAAATLLIQSEYNGSPLTWRYPIVGVAVSRPLQRPILLHVPARQPLRRELSLPLPGLQSSAVDTPFTFELDLPEEEAEMVGSSLSLAPLQRTLAGGSLSVAVDWRPLRPMRTSAALIVRMRSGGRWRYELVLEAGEPAPDDVITIEAPINKTAQVRFKLCNAFDEDAPFAAYFTPESPSVFTVSPAAGVLTRAGTAGTMFTISYTPVEYGKQVRGTLVVLTDEMQWSYEVRGSHPQYTAPSVTQTKVDHVLDPALSMRLGQPRKKNFLKHNMRSGASKPVL